MSYSPRIDRVIDGNTSDYTREDWIRLAIAALDQAIVSPSQLANAYRHGKGGIEGVLAELELEDQ